MPSQFGDDFFREAMGRARSPLNEFMQMATPGYAKPDFGAFGSTGQGLTAKAPGMDQMPGFGLTSSPAFPNPENEFMGAVSLWQKSQGEIASANAAKKARDAAQAQKAQNPPSSSTVPARDGSPLEDQIVGMAATRFGQAAAPVIRAILRVENGLTGQVGDNGNSFGPFQFYTGGQLQGFARSLGVDPRTAGEIARTEPLRAAQWALDTYIGSALERGIANGLQGSQLLDAVLQVQNPGAVGNAFGAKYHMALNQAAQQQAVRTQNPSEFTMPQGLNARPVPSLGGGTYIPPVDKVPGVTYGATHWGEGRNALDIMAPRGTPIRAMVSGTAYYAHYSAGGHTVTLLGDDGRQYYLAHMDGVDIPQSGRVRVEQGQQLGRVGHSGGAWNNGRVTPTAVDHLHIGIASSHRPGAIDPHGQGDLHAPTVIREVGQ